jgi:hypothetical protein
MWALINVQPLADGGHRRHRTGYVSTITDISKRKQAELEIVRLNVNLEKRVCRAGPPSSKSPPGRSRRSHIPWRMTCEHR